MCGSPKHRCRRGDRNVLKLDASMQEGPQECVEARCINAGGSAEIRRRVMLRSRRLDRNVWKPDASMQQGPGNVPGTF